MTEANTRAWLYLGSIHGTFIRTPFRIREKVEVGTGEEYFERCDSYDPRLRPWYIAASTGPKDVVILLDISLSMSDPQEMPRLTLAKNALFTMLKTFTFRDYVNIVTFEGIAVPLWDESPLMQATTSNLEKLRERMDLVEANGDTDFNVAFDVAFGLLLDAARDERHLHTSRCTSEIIFLTDGVDCSHTGSFCSIRYHGPSMHK